MRLIDVPQATELAGSITAGNSKRTNQHCPWCAVIFSYDIQTKIHAVDKVNIGKPGRSEHDTAAVGYAAKGMASRIVFSVSFHFDYLGAQNFT